MDDFLQGLLGIARDTVGRLDVSIKTNYGPEIPIPTSSDGQPPGLFTRLIGFRGGIIIRNSRGEIIETVGDPAPTEPLRVAALIAVASLAGFALVRGIIK
jgi:hypothetical protein